MDAGLVSTVSAIQVSPNWQGNGLLIRKVQVRTLPPEPKLSYPSRTVVVPQRKGAAMIDQYINHIALVLDASGSMNHLREQVVRVADNQISHLAQRSKELDQETRVTVYVFHDTVECVIYDKDVLRLPSIREHYRGGGMTALVDATMKSQKDLAATAQLYGNHAFLTYVLTDGMENRSRQYRPYDLARKLETLPGNWTVGVFVPDQSGVFEAKKFGFPKDNISVWDTTERGLTEVGETVRRTTDDFMTARTRGVHGTRSLFSTGVDALNTRTVQAANLTELPIGSYHMLKVIVDGPIRETVYQQGHQYVLGRGYYQLTKTETIQAGKEVAVREKATGKVYTGRAARDLLGLPDITVRVKPDHNPLYDVFVQSTSVNRKLLAGTELLLLA